MRRRIEVLNIIYDEVHHLYGGLCVDLAAHPGVYDRKFWSVDRLHPSELGHRTGGRHPSGGASKGQAPSPRHSS